jgi:hypothetical protein
VSLLSRVSRFHNDVEGPSLSLPKNFKLLFLWLFKNIFCQWFVLRKKCNLRHYWRRGGWHLCNRDHHRMPSLATNKHQKVPRFLLFAIKDNNDGPRLLVIFLCLFVAKDDEKFTFLCVYLQVSFKLSFCVLFKCVLPPN